MKSLAYPLALIVAGSSFALSVDFSTDGVTVSTSSGGLPAGKSAIAIGFGGTYNGWNVGSVGFVQAEAQGIAYRNLLLQPLGGYVGVGVTAPAVPLHVVGATNVAGRFDISSVNGVKGAANLVLCNANPTVGNASGIDFLNAGGNPVAFISGVNHNHAAAGAQSGGLAFSVASAGSWVDALQIYPGGTTAITVNGPNALYVEGTSANSVGMRIKNVATRDFSIGVSGSSGALFFHDNTAGATRGYISAIGELVWDGSVRARGDGAGSFKSAGIAPGVWLEETDGFNKGAHIVLDGGYLQFQRRVAGFGGYEAAPFSCSMSAPQNSVLISDTGALILGGDPLGTGLLRVSGGADIKGTVRTKEVVVTLNGWSDYVFDPHYDLMPLKEVERHIEASRHLPGVPSSTDVARDGVSIGDMQAVHMRKIEELTLYAIDADRELTTTRGELTAAKRELATAKQDIIDLAAQNRRLNERLERIEAALARQAGSP